LQASALSVSIDGNRILHRPFGALPPKMLLAFTAATGSKTDSHLIRDARHHRDPLLAGPARIGRAYGANRACPRVVCRVMTEDLQRVGAR